jgi:hypothetical protein
MPEIKRLFNASRMNRDLDDKMLKPGEYREALNINVSKSESSDIGAVENILGNKLINDTALSGAKVIGEYRDNGNERIYYFITTNSTYNEINSGSHQIIEYNQKANKSTILVSSAALNFHQSYPITGINLVDELLFFTDDRNAPRKINVETARNTPGRYNLALNVDDVVSVAKYAPYTAATIVGVSNLDEQGNPITSNFLENKLIRFSYRYQFEDGEYSVLAPFTPICFSRLDNVDTIATNIEDFGEIETFVNAIKSVQLSVPTPQGFGISKVELIYKETGSGALYVVENKVLTSETTINFFYKSQDPFKTLPADQLTRVSDAVPRTAKSQELAGGRLIYGNYLQNFNIPSVSFTVSRTGEDSARYTALDDSMSVKSRRTYQVGIVLADKFGRQTPVLLSETGGDTVFIDAATGESDSTNVFNSLRIAFSQTTIDTLQALDWCYSYRIVVKQREQEYYNWISTLSGLNTVNRFGDSINKIPRDQTAVIPPSTSATISPCDTAVYPKIIGGVNKTTATLNKVQSINNPAGTANVPTDSATSGVAVFETEPVISDLDIFYETSTGGLISSLTTTAIDIQFYNCYLLTFSSGTHIEVNRLRAGYNEKAFDVGVRAYVVKENFAEERRFNTLIHSSGLFNSRTNINYINQFNEAEGGITISLDPQDGSVQKLFADDTQIVVFQEDKISRSPVNKDFIYSAEGGAIPVTTNTQFLGTIAPYAGEFGISKDPKSFAYYGYAKYFTDKNRGSVMRLSQNGLVEISNNGMSDFFRDALKKSNEIIGSYDEYNNLYNLTLIGKGFSGFKDTNLATATDGYFTISFDESSQGWTSFKSFEQEGGLSLNNIYYTFKNGKLWQHNDDFVNRNTFYGAAAAESYIEPILNDNPSTVKTFNNISYEGTSGWELDFLTTDISAVGDEPAIENYYAITLQLSGAADNSIITGEQTIYAKNNETIQWVVTAKPKNSDYEFNSITDVTLTGSGLNIQNPTVITNNNLVFLVSYTATASNETKIITIGGNGAELVFEVNLLTISVGDAVANGAVSPALATYTSAGANNLDVTVSPISTHYIDPGLISANITGLTQATAITASTITKNVIVRNYGGANKFAIEDVSNGIDYLKQPILVFTKGKTYRLDQSDSSNTGHPIKFSTTSDGTHGGGSEYTTGVTYNGTPGSAGAYTEIQITSGTPTLYYYCDVHSGYGGSTNIVPFNLSFSNGNMVAGFPITVPASATNNSLGISGNAVVLPQLTWATPASGVLTTPAGTSVNVVYTISPYDAVARRTATIRWTASGTDKVFLPDGYSITYDVVGNTIGNAVLDSTSQEYLERTIILPAITENTTASATITGSGEVTASVGTYTSSITFSASGNTNTSIDNTTNGATIPIQISANQSWVLLNGSPGTKVVDPDGIDFVGSNYPFTINVDDNTTGAQRTATITIAKYNNARVTGTAVANQTISITQNA